LGTATAASAASVASPGIVEHYDGQTFTLTPDNWNGATDCAFVTPTDAYCFNNDAAFESFTGVPRNADGQAAQGTPLGGASPDTSGTCNGWAKIWNGTNFTDTGLAFEDYGSAQYLGDYTQVPFKVVSWFTDGQRGYSAMTNCYGETLNSGGVDVLVLHTNAQADSMGPVSSYYIELFSGTD
jgi:hypothetical protein